jgi:hypothetical protein
MRGAIALLLARLDGDSEREHEVLRPWVEAEHELGALIAALAEVALALGGLGRSDEQLRTELTRAAERLEG